MRPYGATSSAQQAYTQKRATGSNDTSPTHSGRASTAESGTGTAFLKSAVRRSSKKRATPV